MRKIALLLLALPLAAALDAGQEHLKLGALVEEALRANPEIRAAQKKYEAARQRPAQEKALPDPMISAGWNSSGNPLPFAGIGKEPVANVGLMASQELPAPGKLRLRAEVAIKEADAEGQQYRTVELAVASQVKQAYFRLQHAAAMERVLERGRELLRQLLRVTEARYTVGKATQADVLKAQTQITLMETRLVQSGRERRARVDEINHLTGRAPGTALDEPEEPRIETLGIGLEELLAKAKAVAPTLERDQKMIDRAAAAVSLAKKDYLPEVTLNGGYYYMGSMPSMYMFRADVRLPLRRSRTRAEVAERGHEEAEARLQYRATARGLDYRIREEYGMAETAAKLVELYEKVAMPQTRTTVESALVSYESGTVDFLSVLMNQMAVIDTEMSLHDQMREYHLSLARLEEMTGVELIQ